MSKMARTHFCLAVNITHKMLENTLETTNMSLTRPGDLVLSGPVRQFFFVFFLDFLDHIGPYWTNLDHFVCLDPSIWTRLLGPVYLYPSICLGTESVYCDLYIWTCLFWLICLDLSIWTHLNRPVYLDLSAWTRLLKSGHLDPSIWTSLFGPVDKLT